jgi:hypothetical protein
MASRYSAPTPSTRARVAPCKALHKPRASVLQAASSSRAEAAPFIDLLLVSRLIGRPSAAYTWSLYPGLHFVTYLNPVAGEHFDPI